jgi:hypothetical protein
MSEQETSAPSEGADVLASASWTPVWAMPNVTLEESIEASHAALVNRHDERLRSIARRCPALETFLNAFRDEFGTQIWPTIAMVREGVSPRVRTVTALSGFRDAVCVSAIVAGHGIIHSDAFDVYPWFPDPRHEGRISAFTPAMIGTHYVEQLRPQPAPALGRRSLSPSHMDQPLLGAILARWKRCFVDGEDSMEDRRLFRALEMARAASKMPGGSDATDYDGGRAVALWVSAFEILVHDEKWSGLKEVLTRLGQVQWLSAKLEVQDRQVKISKKETFQTNAAGEVYGHLNRVRNDFLHGNPVTAETLKRAKRQQSVLFFASPLFRLALTASLNVRFSETLLDTANDEDLGRHIAKQAAFNRPQRRAEDAILMADEASD